MGRRGYEMRGEGDTGRGGVRGGGGYEMRGEGDTGRGGVWEEGDMR